MAAPRGLDHRLVGRASEWTAARHAIRDGRAGVIFAGPPGVGKTSLARAVVDELARREPVEVVHLFGSVGSPVIPFAAFAPVAPDVGLRTGRDPLGLLQTFRSAVLRRAEGRPLVLAVDDGHRLDICSAALLFQLVADDRARLVMSIETGAPLPDALLSLWKDELVERIEVGPLDRASTVELVAGLLHGRDDLASVEASASLVAGRLIQAVWRLGRGNPLYTRELLRAGCASGRIVSSAGVWQLEGELEVGPRLTEMLRHRVERLDPAARDALELLAFAEPLPLRVLVRVAGPDPLDALQRAGLLTFDADDEEQTVAAGHPVTAEMVRRAIPLARSADLGRRLADATEAEGRADRDLLKVVAWRVAGGEEMAPEQLILGAQRAAAEQQWGVSARLARLALERGAGSEAVLALADAARALGRFQEALAALDDLPHGTDDHVARAAVLRASILFFGLDRPADAFETLAGGVHEIADPSARAWLEAVGAGLHAFAGRLTEAVERAEELLSRPELDRRGELTVRAALSLGLSWTGRAEQALAVLETDIPDSEQVAVLSSWSVTAQVLCYRSSGRLDLVERLATARFEQAVTGDDWQVQGSAAGALGWVALERGRLARAVHWFREATAALRSADFLAIRAEALVGLAETLVLTGDLDGARAALDEARPAADRPGTLQPAWQVAYAWLTAAHGGLADGLDQLGTAAGMARVAGQTASEIKALHSVVRLGSGAPASRLAELAGWAEGPLVPVVAAHAAALSGAGGTGQQLDVVAERYAELGMHLYAAEAAAQACRAHQTEGQSRRAAASAARGHFLLGSGDPARPPLGLALALAAPELTRREREVAMLAARAMPSQVIATRLCLSVRTVETHLARAYVKLGIGGRAELAVALVSSAADPARVETG